jgi:hypothetical protein
MSTQMLRFTLTEGVMQQQAAIVPRAQLQQLSGYLAAKDAGAEAFKPKGK